MIGLSLGLMGSGGSILTVPVLVYIVGQHEKVAVAGSLAVVGAISLIACLPYARRGLVSWANVGLFGVPGMFGAYGGAFVAKEVSGSTQLIVFACVMLLAAGFMLRPMQLNGDTERERRAAWKIGLDGLFVGALTGFVGVGGGFLIVPALVLLGGMSMRNAVGTSLVVIALKSATGFFKYVQDLDELGLQLDWVVLAKFFGFGVVGSFAGSALSSRVPQDGLKRGFGVFLIVMGTYVLATKLA